MPKTIYDADSLAAETGLLQIRASASTSNQDNPSRTPTSSASTEDAASNHSTILPKTWQPPVRGRTKVIFHEVRLSNKPSFAGRGGIVR